MKKLLCLILSVLLVLSFAACASEEDDDRESRKSKKNKESTSDVVASAGSYEDAIDLCLKVFVGSITKSDVKQMFPDDLWEYMAEEEGESVDELCEEMYDMLKETKADMEEAYGDGFSAEYEILDKKTFDGEEYDEFKEGAEESCGLDPDKFGKCYEMKMRVVVSFEDEEEEQNETIHMFEYDGEWYIAEVVFSSF